MSEIETSIPSWLKRFAFLSNCKIRTNIKPEEEKFSEVKFSAMEITLTKAIHSLNSEYELF